MTNREETGKYGYWYMCTQGNKLRHDTTNVQRWDSYWGDHKAHWPVLALEQTWKIQHHQWISEDDTEEPKELRKLMLILIKIQRCHCIHVWRLISNLECMLKQYQLTIWEQQEKLYHWPTCGHSNRYSVWGWERKDEDGQIIQLNHKQHV